MKSLKEGKEYFYNLHDIECNQKYSNNLPYSFHLDLVAMQALKFEKYIFVDDPYYTATWIGIYGHDSIEDARVSYNEIKNKFGEIVADVIYACTEYRGKTREERKPEQFYVELKLNEIAVFVKLCDIIANSLYSQMTGSTMFKKYKKEYEEKVRKILYTDQYKDMFTYLDKIYDL
jgi:(p)ppGpp synthase/HD superfamily hydrolase